MSMNKRVLVLTIIGVLSLIMINSIYAREDVNLNANESFHTNRILFSLNLNKVALDSLNSENTNSFQKECISIDERGCDKILNNSNNNFNISEITIREKGLKMENKTDSSATASVDLTKVPNKNGISNVKLSLKIKNLFLNETNSDFYTVFLIDSSTNESIYLGVFNPKKKGDATKYFNNKIPNFDKYDKLVITGEKKFLKSNSPPENQNNNSLVDGNGVYTNIWTNAQVLSLLKDENIKYLFVDVGDTDQFGNLQTDYSEIIQFLEMEKAFEETNNYNFIILPYSEINMQISSYKSRNFYSNIILTNEKLVDSGFDGVHLDIEAIPLAQRNNYLRLLNDLRSTLPEGKIISLYAGTINDKNPTVWEWDSKFYKEVSKRVDFISIATFDYGKEDKTQYQSYLKNQLDTVLGLNLSSEIFFLIPTHKPEPETAANSLEILNGDKNKFAGIAIFTEYTTDSNEWNTINDFLQS